MLSKSKLVTAMIFSLGVCSAQANTVSVLPASQTVNIGDVFAVDIVGTGFTTPLDAGGINLSFDLSVLSPVLASPPDYATFGSSWTTSFQPVLNGNTLEDIFFFADTAPSGDFNIVTLWFEAIGTGSSVIDITESQLNPFAGAGGALSVKLVDGNVTVSTVPVPAAAWLFGSGMLGLGAIARRKPVQVA